jgi:hypothetical protein
MAALRESDPYFNRWDKEEHVQFLDAVDKITALHSLRNFVVHGTWTSYPRWNITDDEAKPRPWGNTIGDPNDKVALRISAGLVPFHAADFCGRVTAMWLRIRRW